VAHAQSPQAIFAPGDLVVSGFSGTTPQAPMIDFNDYAIRILRPAPNGPAQGQLINAAPVFGVSTGQIGQVFGIALDDAAVPNIYVAATSAFGLHIVVPDPPSSDQLKRVKNGDPNADWMPGQFGTGGPGGIYKIDGQTGEVSLFATIPGNSGPGLGSIVFDPASRQFFASDLDSGLIHRLGADGHLIDTFDHGVAGRRAANLAPMPDDGTTMNVHDRRFDSADPATWGLTPKARRIGGVAVRGGRLYYAVADGPQIWSVGLAPDGGFAADARPEIDGSSWPTRSAVADMNFDGQGTLYLAQRGDQRGGYDYDVFAEPGRSLVLRYPLRAGDATTVSPADPETFGMVGG
jgi:hypothetical protein